MSQFSVHAIYFPPYHISAEVDLLYRSESVVPLQPQAVRCLRYLAEHHDRVVSKEELLSRVWTDTFKTEGVLKKAILQVRRALGDDVQDGRYIETYHGRGYRFVAPVVLSALSDRQSAQQPNYDQLIGRDMEMSLLKAEYRQTVESVGRPVLILGDPGIGKTQLARYFGNWATEQGALFLYARFFDYRGSHLAPYEVFLDLLRTALKNLQPADQEFDLREMMKKTFGVNFPDELFAGVHSHHALHSGLLGADSYRAILPISSAFLCLAKRKQLVVVFDDLQWADEASREMIGYLMRTAQTAPLMLLALVRAEQATEASSQITEWVKRQANYHSFTMFTLSPLEESTCRTAIDAVFGGSSVAPEIPVNDLRTLANVSGGNPYFLMEMLRFLITENVITFGGTQKPSWQWHGMKNLRLPQTLVLAAKAKLEQLSDPGVRSILEQAAVIGDEFRVQTLSLMTGKPTQNLEPLLRETLTQGILLDRGLSAGEDYRFYHTILRHVLYDSIRTVRVRRLHKKAAEALAIVYASETDRIAEAISMHWQAAGNWHRTFEWSMKAWKAASRRWNWNQAAINIVRASRAADEIKKSLKSAERLQLLLAMGEAYFSVGNLKVSESVLIEAVNLAELLRNDRARAASLLQLGVTQTGLAIYRVAKVTIEQAMSFYRRIKDRDGVSLSKVQLGSIEAAMGNYEAAKKLIKSALDHQKKENDIAALGFGILGWTLVLQGRYSEGMPHLRKALEYHTRTGDLRRRALLLRRMHWGELSRGRMQTAIELACRARDDFRSAGDFNGEAKSNMGIGQSRIAQGLYQEGISFLQRANENLKVTGGAHSEAECLWLLGRAKCELGRTAQAESLLLRALEMVEQIGDRDDVFRILIDLARVKIAQEDYEAAMRSANQAISISQELGSRDGPGIALVECARASLKLHRISEALDSAQRAVQLLDACSYGERWRAHWVLALALEASGSQKRKLVAAFRQALELVDEIRNQLDPSDTERRMEITRAFSGPAVDCVRVFTKFGLTNEAKTISKKWMLERF